MKIYLLDINEEITRAWQLYFAGIPDVKVVRDDFTHFMNSFDVECVVSPANSYGLMDGGYDAAISAYFGEELIPCVQSFIRKNFACEQPVGTSFIIDIPKSNKKLIHTPTMRVPSLIREPMIVYQCMRTTLLCANQNNIASIVIPAFGGQCGGLQPHTIAFLMREAFNQIKNPPEEMDWEYAVSHQPEKINISV